MGRERLAVHSPSPSGPLPSGGKSQIFYLQLLPGSRVWCPGARRQLLLPSPPRSFAGALSLCRTADHSPPGDCMGPAAWRGPWVLTGCGEDLCPQQFGDICGLRTGGLQESEPDTHTQAGVSPGMARDGTRDAEGAVASRAAHMGWLPAPRTPENQTRFCGGGAGRGGGGPRPEEPPGEEARAPRTPPAARHTACANEREHGGQFLLRRPDTRSPPKHLTRA